VPLFIKKKKIMNKNIRNIFGVLLSRIFITVIVFLLNIYFNAEINLCQPLDHVDLYSKSIPKESFKETGPSGKSSSSDSNSNNTES
jgi:hypothetical protein